MSTITTHSARVSRFLLMRCDTAQLQIELILSLLEAMSSMFSEAYNTQITGGKFVQIAGNVTYNGGQARTGTDINISPPAIQS